MTTPSVVNNCECCYHRYHVVHVIAGDPKVYDHSQSTWDTVLRGLPRGSVQTFPSVNYRHGMSAVDLRAEAAATDRHGGRRAAVPMKRTRPPKYRSHSLLTFAQAGEVLGLSRWTVRAMADDGRLVTYTVPGDPRRIRRVRYDELLAVKRQIEESATTGSRRGGAEEPERQQEVA